MYKYIAGFFLLILVVGCGGGSSSSSSGSTAPIDIETKYSGLKSAANLDPALVRITANDLLFIESFALNLFSANSYLSSESIYDNPANLTNSCEEGGTVRLKTSKTNSLGIADIYYDGCRIEGIRIDGSSTFVYNFLTDGLAAELKNYRISNEVNESLVLNGTIKTTADKKSLLLRLLREIENDQLLVKNLLLNNPIGRTNEESPTYKGQFYYSTQGKVELSLTEGFTDYNDIPHIYFSEGAKLQLDDTQGNKAYLQIIDENGYAVGNTIPDLYGIDDENATVEISYDSESEGYRYGKVALGNLLVLPVAGSNPIAKETLSAGNVLSYANYQSIDSLASGIQLDGRNSIDPEGALLSFEWKIVDSPSGSEAALSSTSVATPQLIVDYFGAYTIQLVVSDGVNKSEPIVIAIEVGGSEFNPLDQFGGISWSAELIDGSYSDGPFWKPVTSLELVATPYSFDIPDFLKFDIEWDLVDQPLTSSSSLQGSRLVKPRFTPDVAGSYTLKATVNTGFNSYSDTVSIDVFDFDKSVTPKVKFYASGSQTAYVGFERTLEFEYLAELGSNEYTSILSLIEKPSNANPQAEVIVNQSELVSNQVLVHPETIFSFKFDQPGRYIYEIVASNGDYDIAPMDLVFNVIDSSTASLTEDAFTSEITPPDNYAYGNTMAMADINKDGFNDLVLVYTNYFGHKYQVLYGKADQTFNQSSLFDAPSDDLIGMMDINDDSNLELVFRKDNGSNISVLSLTNSFSDIPISFDSTYYVDSFSDVNSDGLKDIILLKKGDINNNFTHEGVAYSLQSENNSFSSPVKIPVTNKFIWKINHDGANNSLLVVSESADTYGIEDSQSLLHVDELQYQQSGFSLLSSKIINYKPVTPFGTTFYPMHIIDLDGDGTKEIIGSSKIADYSSEGIWKKNNSNNSYEKSQKISLFNSQDNLFADMDSDGDIDIVRAESILYQDEQKQFRSEKTINRDLDSARDLLPFVGDIDNDDDKDMFTIFRIYSDGLVPNIKVLRNTVN